MDVPSFPIDVEIGWNSPNTDDHLECTIQIATRQNDYFISEDLLVFSRFLLNLFYSTSVAHSYVEYNHGILMFEIEIPRLTLQTRIPELLQPGRCDFGHGFVCNLYYIHGTPPPSLPEAELFPYLKAVRKVLARETRRMDPQFHFRSRNVGTQTN